MKRLSALIAAALCLQGTPVAAQPAQDFFHSVGIKKGKKQKVSTCKSSELFVDSHAATCLTFTNSPTDSDWAIMNDYQRKLEEKGWYLVGNTGRQDRVLGEFETIDPRNYFRRSTIENCGDEIALQIESWDPPKRSRVIIEIYKVDCK